MYLQLAGWCAKTEYAEGTPMENSLDLENWGTFIISALAVGGWYYSPTDCPRCLFRFPSSGWLCCRSNCSYVLVVIVRASFNETRTDTAFNLGP